MNDGGEAKMEQRQEQQELKAATEEVLTTTALPLPPCRIYDYDDEGVEEDPDLANVLVVGGGEIRRLQKEETNDELEYDIPPFPPQYRSAEGVQVRAKEAILVSMALMLLVCSILLFFKHWKKNYRDINQLPYYAYLYQKEEVQFEPEGVLQPPPLSPVPSLGPSNFGFQQQQQFAASDESPEDELDTVNGSGGGNGEARMSRQTSRVGRPLLRSSSVRASYKLGDLFTASARLAAVEKSRGPSTTARLMRQATQPVLRVASTTSAASAATGSVSRGQKWVHHQHSLQSHQRGAAPGHQAAARLPSAGLPGAARYMPPKRAASDLYSRFNNVRFGSGSGGIDFAPRRNNSGGVGGIFLDELSSTGELKEEEEYECDETAFDKVVCVNRICEEDELELEEDTTDEENRPLMMKLNLCSSDNKGKNVGGEIQECRNGDKGGVVGGGGVVTDV